MNDSYNSCQICGKRISPYKQTCHECEVKYKIRWGDSITQKLQEYIQNLERGEKLTLDEVIQLIKQALEKVNPDKHTEFRFTVGQVKQLLGWLEDYKQLKTDYIDFDKQLRTSNTENDELKRLLRLAIDDFQTAMLEEKCKVCGLEHCDYDEICKCRHHDEAMELLGGTENAEN